MATEIFRKNLLAAYKEVRKPDMFLASLFTVRPENIKDTETVAIDVERDDEEISPVVHIAEGPTINKSSIFTTKEFTPPTIQEMMPFDVRELLKRMAGVDEYSASGVGFQAQLVQRLLSSMDKLENKIRRNREWQASQILQDPANFALKDSAGNDVYTIDFKPKATHFFAAGTAWSGAGTPITDINTALDLIRTDSGFDGDMCIMGDTSFNAFVKNSEVLAHYDNRRIDMGGIRPELRNSGGKLQGVAHIGNYEVEIWTYNGRGIPPGGAKIKFVNAASCIVMSSIARLDTVFAGVPVPVDRDPRFEGVLPDRISIPQGVDLAPNIWATPNGKQINVEIESRPLLIPTAIDSFAKIATGV